MRHERDPEIRLSTKELSALPARVLASSHMPWGAVEGAIEAIQFLELAGADGLRVLSGDKEVLAHADWSSPEILDEGPGWAVGDVRTAPSLFYGPAIPAWLASSAGSEPFVLALQGGILPYYLDAVPFLIAKTGSSSVVVRGNGARGDGELRASAASRKAGRWTYTRGPIRMFSPLAQAIRANGTAEMTRSQVIDLVKNFGGHPIASEWLRECQDNVSAVVLVFNSNWDGKVSFERGSLNSEEYQRLRDLASSVGWPIPTDLFQELMTFADLSLVPTSEKSRQGAG